MKHRLAHHAMGSHIIKATSCTCPGCQGVSRAAPPLAGSYRKHAAEEGTMHQP
jgi:hypothetical protein